MLFSYTSYNWHQTDITDKCFLITGGAGFIGSHVAEYLLQHHAGKVKVLDNFSLGSKSNLECLYNCQSLEIIEGDITCYEDCRLAMEGVDYVCHLAAVGSVPRSIEDPVTSHQANVTGFLNVLTAAKEADIRGMVYASSSAVYGNSETMPRIETSIGAPLSPYALTKYMNEEYANLFSHVYNFHTTGLRFFNVFGPRQNPCGVYAAVIPRFFKAALENEQPMIYGDGSVVRDFTYVANIVQLCIKAMLHPATSHQVYNGAYGGKISVLELWNAVAVVTGCTLSPQFMPPRKGDIQQSMADISRIVTHFNYQQVADLKQGLLLARDYYISKL